MKIVKIETFARPHVALARITTDSGAQGWGQIATYESADLVAQVLHRQVADVVLGKDPYTQDQINYDVIARNVKFPGSFVCRSLAAIDTAMWDLKGKLEQKPVYALIGGSGDAVAVYGSSMRRDITADDEAARMKQLQDSNGYRAFKLRVGKYSGRDADAWEGRTETLIPTVRKALGEESVILADANGAYRPEKAVEIGKILEDSNYGHFEEPCPFWELDWTKQVTDTLAIPVSGGEQDNWMPVWERMIRDNVVDIVQPDVCYVGGLTRAIKVARMAAERNLLCVPHSANHSLVTVFTLHMWNAMANHGPFLEFSIEPQQDHRAMFTPALDPVDGEVAIPDEGYGWGVTIKEEWLESAQYQESSL